VQLYALHELESANGKYKTGPVTDAAVALDEWWAYYAGSLEDGTAVNGYGPYILVEKHSKAFDTGGRKVGNDGVSSVHAILLAGTKEIKSLMRAAGNDLKINNIIKCTRAQIKVPIIQDCIEYAYKTDPTTKYAGDSTNPGRKAEMWAFCAGVLPFLHEANPNDAKVLRAETDVIRTFPLTPKIQASPR